MKIEYKNGLTLILEPTKAAPVVAVQAWVGVGSADETDKEAGLAHFHEHMLFKGTDSRGVGEIAQDVEGVGGDINAWTSFDETVYHITLPSAHWQTGLEILADVLQHSSFDAEEIRKESEVILEEIKRSEDVPGQRLSQKLFNTAFQTHTYRRPIIGYRETVEGFRRKDLLNFYKKWYTPNNITLVLVGDFDPQQAQTLTQQLFSSQKSKTRPRNRPPEPEQTDLRLDFLQEDVQESIFQVGFAIPDLHHPDLYALEMLSVLLGQLESSRLDLAVRRQKQLANSVSSYAYTPRDRGLFLLSASMPPGKEKPALEASLEEIIRIQHNPPSHQEVEKVRTIIQSDAIYGRETMQGRARSLGYFQAVAGDLAFEERFYNGINRVNPTDIQRVAQQYLDFSRATFVFLTPNKTPKFSITSKQILSIEQKLRKSFHTHDPSTPEKPSLHTLSNGVRVILKENRHAPVVSIRAAMLGGLRFENAKNNGINNLIGRLLDKGTPSHDAEELSLVVDEMAGSIGGFSGRNSLGLQGDFLSQNFEQGLELFTESLLQPTFPQEELEREVYFIQEELRAQEDQSSTQVFELFTRTLFKKHPYRFPIQGTPQTLQSFSSNQLQRYYKKLLVPENIVISVVGDIQREHTLTLLDELFGALKPRPLALPKIPQEPPLTAHRHVHDTKDRMQAHIVLGFPGTTLYDKDRYAIEVLNGILSGQGGRLFLQLRDEMSLAYSVSSFSLELLDPGYFAVYIGTSPHKVQQAIDAILEQLERIQREPVSDDELNRVKRYLTGSYAISRQRNSSQAFSFALHELYGQGIEEIEKYTQYVEKVTPKQIQKVAKKYFTLQHYTQAIIQPEVPNDNPPAE